METNPSLSEQNLLFNSVTTIETHLRNKPKAQKMWEILTSDDEVIASWRMADYIATKKLGMNDHGETHAKITAASALTMLSLLEGSALEPDVITGGFGDSDDAALVVLTAMLFHDLGNMIHREDHADLSITLALPLLNRILPDIYENPVKLTAIRALILSSMYSHHGEPKPITIEAALVCIGDSTDMTKGRGRAAFEQGSISIHSVSALSIEHVDIRRGKEKPIEILITMSNSAGIYQVQEILAPKVRAGPLAEYVDVIAVTGSGYQDSEPVIVKGIRMKGTKFVSYRDA